MKEVAGGVQVEIAASITKIELGILTIDKSISAAMLLAPDGIAFQIAIELGGSLDDPSGSTLGNSPVPNPSDCQWLCY